MGMLTPEQAQETLKDFIIGSYGKPLELTEKESADLYFFVNLKVDIIRQDISNEEIWNMVKKLNLIANPKIGFIQMCLRDIFTHYFSWAIPDVPVIEQMREIIDNRRVLELGAGRGLWARLLINAGIPQEKYFATNIWLDNDHHCPSKDLIHTWAKIEPFEYEQAIDRFAAEVLFICWGTGPSYEIIEKWLAQSQAQTILVIGENKDGCTFHLTEYKRMGLIKTAKIKIPHWMGIRDKLYVYNKS